MQRHVECIIQETKHKTAFLSKYSAYLLPPATGSGVQQPPGLGWASPTFPALGARCLQEESKGWLGGVGGGKGSSLVRAG